MRTFVGVAIVAFIFFGSLCAVASVGKPRKPLEPGAAVFTLLFNGLLIWGVLYLLGGCS